MYHTSPKVNKGLKGVLYLHRLRLFMKLTGVVLNVSGMLVLLSFLTMESLSVQVLLFHIKSPTFPGILKVSVGSWLS